MRWSRTAAVTLLTGVIALGAAFAVGPLHAVTTQGLSMEPRIAAGDLVAVAPSASYGVGDVAAYRSPLLGSVVLHRIVAVDGDRYVFQGDANSWLDPERPTRAELIGKELLRIPRGGIWLERLTSPPALAAYTFLLLASGTAATTTTCQRRKERARMTDPRPHRLPLDDSPPPLRAVAAAAAVLGLAGAALSGVAWTRPATTVAATSTAVDSTMHFSYTATVPPSAAYDGTTVTAPSPVFRALTDAVDVSYRYAGEPGDLTVAARLSTANGWTATLPLAPAEQIGGAHEGVVRLELSALEERAAAAAAVIGLPADGLTVAVVPTVALERGGEFAPSFPLALGDRTVKPAGESTVSQATDVTGTRQAPAVLSAVGRSVDVATARVVGPVALALALLATVLLVVALRNGRHVTEADSIRRRYGTLLLPVLPVALAPGRPVIDVPDLDALARLAERYGLLVLHWSRSGVDTYVVQDEATTFRYRSDRDAGVPEPRAAAADEGDAGVPELARSWTGTGNGRRSQ